MKKKKQTKKTFTMISAPKGKTLTDEERWQYANFTNAFIFSAILQKNARITKDLIRLFVPDLPVRKIKSIRREERQDAYHDSKTTFLDAEVILKDGTAVMIEMQVLGADDFVKRMRYYRSEADVRHLGHGQPYGSLPAVVQIAICLFDPIGDGYFIYDCELCNRYDNQPVRDNEQRIIFINTTGNRGTMNIEQENFIRYLRGEAAAGDLVERIDTAVAELKNNESERKSFMRFEDLLRDNAAAVRKEALAEGMTKGMAKGMAKGKAEGISEGMAEGPVKARTEDIVRAFDAFKDTGTDSDTAMYMLGKIFFEESPERIREIITKHDSTQKQN